MEILEELFELKDAEYAKFHSNLIPGVPFESIIGVRVPILRKLGKKYVKNPEYKEFLKELPHKYYDENVLHGIVISEIKDYEECINELEAFLPYIDNWAVCDIISPKVFKKNKVKLLDKINTWINSKHIYTCRFGLRMIMSLYLDDDFKREYLDMAAAIKFEEYYVNMMIAWLFATALAKQWDETVKYIEEKRLDKWVHNKTIQKARESYRITGEQKEYLKGLKV